MQPTPTQLQHQGLVALQAGRYPAAREALEAALRAAPADATTLMALAYACTHLGDHPAARQAVDAVLQAEPRNLRALLLKGDLVWAAGDERAAAAFFRAAVSIAPAADTMPADLSKAVDRARQALGRLAGSFEQTLLQHLRDSPAWAQARSSRFDQSLDLLLGRKQLYLQEPRLYCFPELPHKQFFEREAFPWMDALEAQTDAIRDELLAVLRQPGSFSPYLESDETRPALYQGGLLNSTDWSAFYLWRNGEPVAAHADSCPRTMAALQALPLPRIPGRSPNILFSQLRPGAHIPPHHGFVNTRLIVHLPLVVPPGCEFRVGNETRTWEYGKAWAFDDTIEHEAWNHSAQTRVVLLFEVWRPELTAQERALVGSLFEAIGRHQGGQQDWGI